MLIFFFGAIVLMMEKSMDSASTCCLRCVRCLLCFTVLSVDEELYLGYRALRLRLKGGLW